MQAFVQEYRSQYNQDPDLFAVCGYDAAAILAQAAAGARSSDPAKIQDALQNVQDAPTLVGSVSIGAGGNAVMPMTIEQIRNGARHYYVTIDPGDGT